MQKSETCVLELPRTYAIFKLLWKSQSHYGSTQLVPKLPDAAHQEALNREREAQRRLQLVQEVQLMRSVIRRMRRSYLQKDLVVIFEAEENKYDLQKPLRKQLKNKKLSAEAAAQIRAKPEE